MVERRSSEVLSTHLTNDGPVYHARSRSVHLGRAKSITRFDGRHVKATFSMSRVLEKFPERKVLLFLTIKNFLLTQCRIGGVPKPAQFIQPFLQDTDL